MNTKNVPALVMLLAGAVTSVLMIMNDVSTKRFLVTVLVVLICFYFIGSIIKVVLDKTFGVMADDMDDIQFSTSESVDFPDEDIDADFVTQTPSDDWTEEAGEQEDIG